MPTTDTSTAGNSAVNSQELLVDIDAQIASLERCQKQLKRPSNISLVERTGLAGKAARSAAELREVRAQLSQSDTEETATQARAALERAAAVLISAGAGHAANAGQRPRDGGQRRPGEHGRGGPSQVRTPNRSGGD